MIWCGQKQFMQLASFRKSGLNLQGRKNIRDKVKKPNKLDRIFIISFLTIRQLVETNKKSTYTPAQKWQKKKWASCKYKYKWTHNLFFKKNDQLHL